MLRSIPPTLGLALALALAVSSATRAQVRDNVLIFIGDDIGVDYVGAYGEGSAPAPTPTLDALAARGVLFRNAWAYPTCSPARAAVVTGRYGYRTGVGAPPATLALDEIALPEALDAAASGYAHAWIGKWHLANANNPRHPNDSGWSHFAGMITSTPVSHYDWSRTVNGASARSTAYITTQNVDDALTWIQGRTQPWVCVVGFFDAHEPYHAPPAHLHTQNLQGLDPNVTPIPFYRAAIQAMDTEIARLLGGLGGALDRTNVVFLGDNGTPRRVSQAPFLGIHAKGTPYEGGVNVPFVVAGPAVTAPGREVAALVSVVDLYATTGDLAGVDLRQAFLRQDSVSLAPYLRNPSQAALRSAVYAEQFDTNTNPDQNGFVTARNAQYKLIRTLGTSVVEEFYDLAADPFEATDLLRGTLSPIEQQNRLALAAHIDEVRSTTGRFVAFGAATCVGSNGNPTIAGAGTPRVGMAYTVDLSQAAPNSAAVFVLGTSDQRFGAIPLPFDLALLGAGPGCALHVSADAQLGVGTTAAGTASVSVPLPDLRLLLAGSVFHTWLVFDPAAPNNPLRLTATQGLAAIVGR